MVVASRERVDLRCPVGPRQLLGRARVGDHVPVHVNANNLVELSCRDCTKNARQFDPAVIRVIHCFNIAGELVESLTER